jgi:hypothetical protein
LWLLNEGVKVTGNVLLTSEIPYDKEEKDLVCPNAVGVWIVRLEEKAYIIYQTVKPLAAHSFFFIRSYQKPTPGSQNCT